MGETFYFQWEEQYMIWIQHLGTGVVQDFLFALNNFFSMFGEELICIAIMGIVYWGIDKEKGKRIGLVVVCANVCNGMVKNIFCRLRPYQVLDEVSLLREVGGYSFPSGHSANAAALYPTTAYEFRKKKWLTVAAVIIPICVAVSRNYLGAHWPTDVIAGLLQGLLIFLLVEFLWKLLKNQYAVMGILLGIGAIGMFYCQTSDYFKSYGMLLGVFFGFLFEEKLVKFENTKSVGKMILRTVGGGILFVVCNTLLKKILGPIFLEETMGYFLLQTLRYAIVVFILIGVYPIVFSLGRKK